MKKTTLLVMLGFLIGLTSVQAQKSKRDLPQYQKTEQSQNQQKLENSSVKLMEVSKFVIPVVEQYSEDEKSEFGQRVYTGPTPVDYIKGGTARQVNFNDNRVVACNGSLADYTNSAATGTGGPSQNFGPANDAFDSIMADDFIAPGATFSNICQLDVTGFYSAGGGLNNNPANMVVMRIYDDNGGIPGNLIFQEAFPGSVDADGDANFSLDPTNAPTLTSGDTYWMSVQADMTFANGGQWFWETASDGNGNPYVWQNPGGGFGLGCTTWAPGQGCGIASGTGPDLSMNISFNDIVGTPPVINCSMDIIASTNAGTCEAIVNFGAPSVFDLEDNPNNPVPVQTLGLPSGSAFPVGDTLIEFSVTDSDNNTSTCQFTVTVNDNELPEIVCQDITVELDSNGDATVDVNQTVVSTSDNCGVASIDFGGVVPMSLTTSFASNNGAAGNMFDMMALNDIVMDSFDVNMEPGNTDTVEVYFKVGTWVGFEMDPGAWTLVGSSTVTSNGQDTPTPLNLDMGVVIPSGQLVAWYVTSATMSTLDYTNGGTVGDLWASDSNMEIYQGAGRGQGVFTGGVFTTRNVNTTAHYSVGGLPVGDMMSFDCSDVGANVLEIIVTDDSGNTASCFSTITIEDNMAPVIICEGEPVPSTDSISATPGLAIDTDPGNVVVTSVINIAADETITDMDVDLDISHTWVGDLIITLESPGGTVVNLFNGPTLDCGEVDILATLDDAAATLMDDECNPGQVPTIDGTFMPTSPLAAFNGESTFGNWTLTVTDNFPGLDSGTLNEWGMTYGFLDVAMPLDVVLDANGMATINASDLLISATDNCGAVTTTVGAAVSGTASPGPNTGSFASIARGYWFTASEDFTMTGLNVSDAVSSGDQNVQVMRFAAPPMTFPATSSYDELLHYSNGTPGNGFIPVNISIAAGDIIGILGTRDVTDENAYSTDPDIDINGTSIPIVRFLSQNPISSVQAPQGSFSQAPASANVGMVNFTYDVIGTASTIDFTCDDVGENTFEVTVTDSSGNESMCTATVNVIDDIAPILVCMDFTLELGDDGTAVLDPFDLIDPSSFDACGFAVAAVDIEDFDCSDIGTPVLVTLFVNDPSMNPATCQAIVTVVDLLGPEIVCPLDQSQDPGPGNLFYTVPDYWATGEATATDNCTDPVVITSQDPAPGTLLPDGVYTVTITAEDEYGNVSTCDFELTVESILGLEDSELNNAIVMYPNPAQNQVTISNSSNILLDSAAIYDVNGKLVSQINLQDMQQEKVIDVSSLASGVYIVQIQSEQSSVTKRLIKE